MGISQSNLKTIKEIYRHDQEANQDFNLSYKSTQQVNDSPRMIDINKLKQIKLTNTKSLQGINCTYLYRKDFISVFNPVGKYIAIFDIKSYKFLKKILVNTNHDKIINVNELSQGRFCVAYESNAILIWSIYTGKLLNTLMGHYETPYCMIELPGDILMTGALDKTIRFFDLHMNNELGLIKNKEQDVCLDILIIDNNYFVCTSNIHINVYHFEKLTKPAKILKKHTFIVKKIIKLKAYEHIASSSYGFGVIIWDWIVGISMRVINGSESWVQDIGIFTENIVVVVGDDAYLRLWDYTTGEQILKIKRHNKAIENLWIKNRVLITSSNDYNLKFWAFT